MGINSTLRNLGIGLVVFGIIVISGFIIYNTLSVLLATENNVIVKISITAILLGILLTLLSLFKERIEKEDRELERRY